MDLAHSGRAAVAGLAVAALIAGLLALRDAGAQQQEILGTELDPEEIAAASEALKKVLVSPRERALRQVLTEARVELDHSLHNEFTYDLIVQYDPGRYRDPQAGLYPMTFESQLIFWGKRIAVYTRSNTWRAGRFYLHDISSGIRAWILVNETRSLYPPSPEFTYPPAADPDSPGFRAWLKLIHNVETGTDLRRMSRLFRLMRFESREEVQRRALEQRAKVVSEESP